LINYGVEFIFSYDVNFYEFTSDLCEAPTSLGRLSSLIAMIAPLN